MTDPGPPAGAPGVEGHAGAPPPASEALAELTGRLERAAERLRDPTLGPDEAAGLVEDVARLAGRAAAELERRARDGGR